jgi:tetratricopeptide (TPR) repeat protein
MVPARLPALLVASATIVVACGTDSDTPRRDRATGPASPASVQSAPTSIVGVAEPPELTGEPKPVSPPPTDAERQLLEAITALNFAETDPAKMKAQRDELDRRIRRAPEYADGHTARALLSCDHEPPEDILADIAKALSAPKSFLSGHKSTLRAFRAKLHLNNGHYREAMDDLDAAIKQQVEEAQRLDDRDGWFPVAVKKEPVLQAEPCEWTLRDLDGLVRRFSTDYRVYLYRGMYFSSSAIFDRRYRDQAILDFEKAIALNPRSVLAYYFLGERYSPNTLQAGMEVPQPAKASERAVQAFSRAIELDPFFVPALSRRAFLQDFLERHREAIADYDRLVQIDPEDGSAYHERGQAWQLLGRFDVAAMDFGEAIRYQARDMWEAYSERAAAYMKLGEYEKAIADLNKAIEHYLGRTLLLMNLQRFRALYPEYGGVPDLTVCRKLHALFLPEDDYAAFANGFLHRNGDVDPTGGFCWLYMKRGDAYLKLNRFSEAVREYHRVFDGCPDEAKTAERWRSWATSNTGNELLVDARAMELPRTGAAHVWVKEVMSSATHEVGGYAVECGARRIQAETQILYDSANSPLRTYPAGQWHRAVPDTMGEHLVAGVCAAGGR